MPKDIEIPEHKTFPWKKNYYHQRHWEWKKNFGKSPMSKNNHRWSPRSEKICHLVAKANQIIAIFQLWRWWIEVHTYAQAGRVQIFNTSFDPRIKHTV